MIWRHNSLAHETAKGREKFQSKTTEYLLISCFAHFLSCTSWAKEL